MTRLVLVVPRRQSKRSTTTRPLAVSLLRNSRCYVHGERGAPLDLRHLREQGERVLLLQQNGEARPVHRDMPDEDPRPITLVVVEGNSRQVSRAARRIPGLEGAVHVRLPAQLMRDPRLDGVGPTGLTTFEEIARCMGVFEGPELQMQMERFLERSVGPQHLPASSDISTALASDVHLQVLYEDSTLIAVDKPSGMLVHRGWGSDAVPALQTLRNQIGVHLFPVHRLDRATSGVLLFAKTQGAARAMQALFTSGQITKKYLALCRGNDPMLSWVDHPLPKEPGGDDKRPAQTAFRFLGSHGRYGLYEAQPKTGRNHQIRRHLKHVSHPIIGDVRYGKGDHNRHFRDCYDFHRLALHCTELSFCHPLLDRAVCIHASVPLDFATLLMRLGLDQTPAENQAQSGVGWAQG